MDLLWIRRKRCCSDGVTTTQMPVGSHTLTSSLYAFLKPMLTLGAKVRPGTQLTTTGMPFSQVRLPFICISRPTLQSDRSASLPVQLTENPQ